MATVRNPGIAEQFQITEEQYADWQAVIEIVNSASTDITAGELLCQSIAFFEENPGPSDWKRPNDEEILKWILIAFNNWIKNHQILKDKT